jgi:hypothetical protein
MNGEFGKMWKEAVVNYFKVLSQHYVIGREKSMQKSQSLCRDSNARPSKYEARALRDVTMDTNEGRDDLILTFCTMPPFSIRSVPSIMLEQVPFRGLWKQSTGLLAFVCFSVPLLEVQHIVHSSKNLVFNN